MGVLTQPRTTSISILLKTQGFGYGARLASPYAMSHKEDITVKDPSSAQVEVAEPKFFLLWVGLWIGALAFLLPLLARP
jgi:hypothetical protein